MPKEKKILFIDKNTSAKSLWNFTPNPEIFVRVPAALVDKENIVYDHKTKKVIEVEYTPTSETILPVEEDHHHVQPEEITEEE